jgi:hypothetical protein
MPVFAGAPCQPLLRHAVIDAASAAATLMPIFSRRCLPLCYAMPPPRCGAIYFPPYAAMPPPRY